MSTATLKKTEVPNTFVVAIQKASERVASVSDVNFEGLSNEDLLSVYGLVNGLKKETASLQKNARDEAEKRIRGACEEEEDGTLVLVDGAEPIFTENVDKGYVQMANRDGLIELRPRTKTEFLEAVAREILEEKNLLDFAVDRMVVVTDPDGLRESFEAVQQRLVQLGETKLAQEMEVALEKATEVRETVSQEKIERLVKRKKLSVEDVEGMFDTKTSYALYG